MRAVGLTVRLSLCSCSSPGEGVGDSCAVSGGHAGGGMTRKRRRGIIEKRRRDRINTSLSELRRLVPSAFEKQGSAKLEKAEILQLTVDHLKSLHAKGARFSLLLSKTQPDGCFLQLFPCRSGLDALAYDPHKFAVDYHAMGFRECAAEVARYLVSVEGMDAQDPLRLRLAAHLQCFAAAKPAPAAPAPAAAASGPPPAPLPQAPLSQANTNGWPPAPAASSYAAAGPVQFNQGYHHHHHHQSAFIDHQFNAYGMTPAADAAAAAAAAASLHPPPPPPPPAVMPQVGGQQASYAHHHYPFGPAGAYGPAGGGGGAGGGANGPVGAGGAKPYRPWGAELAY